MLTLFNYVHTNEGLKTTKFSSSGLITLLSCSLIYIYVPVTYLDILSTEVT